MRKNSWMRRAGLPLLAASALLFSGCFETGPQKTLTSLADALNKNDAGGFLSLVDSKRMAQCEMQNMIQEDRALSMLDSLGNRLKLGGVQDLLGQVIDVERELVKDYEKGVSTGSMMAECRTASTPGCPWVPESLKGAEVREISPTAAVARVVTPARMTSWLALQKQGDQWRVVGKASLESTAREYALDQAQARPSAAPTPAASGNVVHM